MDTERIKRYMKERQQASDGVLEARTAWFCEHLDVVAAAYDYLRERYDHDPAAAILSVGARQWFAE